jgi:hypothetical protein
MILKTARVLKRKHVTSGIYVLICPCKNKYKTNNAYFPKRKQEVGNGSGYAQNISASPWPLGTYVHCKLLPT